MRCQSRGFRGGGAGSGAAVPALEGIAQSVLTGAAQYSVSSTGTLVYLTGEAAGSQYRLVWVSRNGEEQTLPAPPPGAKVVDGKGHTLLPGLIDGHAHIGMTVEHLTRFIAFGVTFEIPIAVIILVRSGAVSVEKLVEARPYVIVGAFVVAAVVTPPDVLSQFMLALPMSASRSSRKVNSGPALLPLATGAAAVRIVAPSRVDPSLVDILP
jgi:hypothetical protein